MSIFATKGKKSSYFLKITKRTEMERNNNGDTLLLAANSLWTFTKLTRCYKVEMKTLKKRILALLWDLQDRLLNCTELLFVINIKHYYISYQLYTNFITPIFYQHYNGKLQFLQTEFYLLLFPTTENLLTEGKISGNFSTSSFTVN